jgi:hypothetical protein
MGAKTVCLQCIEDSRVHGLPTQNSVLFFYRNLKIRRAYLIKKNY